MTFALNCPIRFPDRAASVRGGGGVNEAAELTFKDQMEMILKQGMGNSTVTVKSGQTPALISNVVFTAGLAYLSFLANGAYNFLIRSIFIFLQIY